jgi:hypothetical protein
MRSFLAGSLAAILAGPSIGLAQACADLDLPEARSLVAALDTMAGVPPVWSDFTIANHPIVLVSQGTDANAAGCAGIWRHRRTLEVVPIDRAVRFSTPLYGMWNGDPVGPRARMKQLPGTSDPPTVPAALERALRAGGDTRAVIIPAILDLDRLGALGSALRQARVDPVNVLAPIAVHESYHLHSQFPAWLDQQGRYDWPAWDIQPDRRAIVARCYGGSDAVRTALKTEMAALEQAWLSSIEAADDDARARVREQGRAFVDARWARYAMLDTMRVPSPEGPVSCERAEDVMELQEGATQWIGFATAVRAGVVGERSAGRSQAEAFYVMGPFQLLVMQHLLGDERMGEVTRAITRSQQPSGPDGALFGRFAALVSR